MNLLIQIIVGLGVLIGCSIITVSCSSKEAADSQQSPISTNAQEVTDSQQSAISTSSKEDTDSQQSAISTSAKETTGSQQSPILQSLGSLSTNDHLSIPEGPLENKIVSKQKLGTFFSDTFENISEVLDISFKSEFYMDLADVLGRGVFTASFIAKSSEIPDFCCEGVPNGTIYPAFHHNIVCRVTVLKKELYVTHCRSVDLECVATAPHHDAQLLKQCGESEFRFTPRTFTDVNKLHCDDISDLRKPRVLFAPMAPPPPYMPSKKRCTRGLARVATNNMLVPLSEILVNP